MRMHGHAEHDPADYVLEGDYEEYAKKDPVELFESVLVDAGVLDADDAPSRCGRTPGSSPSPRGARRSPTRCPSPATSRTVSMPTESSLLRRQVPATGNATYLEAVGPGAGRARWSATPTSS